MAELRSLIVFTHVVTVPTVILVQVDVLAQETAENPNDALLGDLRLLEKKMGLVLTLVSEQV